MEDFRICPNCEYKRGFHVFFRKPVKGRTRIGLVCPNCGQIYEIGWTTMTVKSFKPEKGLQV